MDNINDYDSDSSQPTHPNDNLILAEENKTDIGTPVIPPILQPLDLPPNTTSTAGKHPINS